MAGHLLIDKFYSYSNDRKKYIRIGQTGIYSEWAVEVIGRDTQGGYQSGMSHFYVRGGEQNYCFVVKGVLHNGSNSSNCRQKLYKDSNGYVYVYCPQYSGASIRLYGGSDIETCKNVFAVYDTLDVSGMTEITWS